MGLRFLKFLESFYRWMLWNLKLLLLLFYFASQHHWTIKYLSAVNWDYFSFPILKPPELQCAEFEECWLSTWEKTHTPLLETSYAIPANHAEEKGTMMRWGGKRGLDGKIHRDSKINKIFFKGWEDMCLLSTNNHTAEKVLWRLKDKDGARSNDYATVKKRLHISKLSNHLGK